MRRNAADRDARAASAVDVRRRRRRSSRVDGGSRRGSTVVETMTSARTYVGEDGRTYRIREPSRVVYKS